jgi:hypothetical protein
MSVFALIAPIELHLADGGAHRENWLHSHELGRSQVKECAETEDESRQTIAMVFFGRAWCLAAYHAGAYEAFSQQNRQLDWVSGSSAGAITAV